MSNTEEIISTAWAALQPGQQIVKHQINRGTLGPHECEIDVLYCGVCGGDINLYEGNWPFGAFPEPQISGHEIVGKVVKTGTDVQNCNIGDMVGVGWQKASCQNCEWCGKGQENMCPGNTGTCIMGAQGGFADTWKGDSRFCFQIPDGLPPQYVGPLMCGGLTVFSPIKKWSSPGNQIGVLGIGGLGHMAIKFAKAKGCTVTAFSRNDTKKEIAMSIGADKYVNTSNIDELKMIERTIDVLIVTIDTYPKDWMPYLDAMRPTGVIVLIGGITNNLSDIPVAPMIMKSLVIAGTTIGGSSDMKEMLQFVADHPDCRPIVELKPMENLNEAIQQVKSSNVRFRMVVQN
jgi:uncharacterized zinc-type alcohol dehydrogenase-like protein